MSFINAGTLQRPGVAAPPAGGVLLVGEDAPGSLLASIRPGIESAVPTTVLNPRSAATSLVAKTGIVVAVRRRVAAHRSEQRLIEAVAQLSPALVVLIKGRGIQASTIREIQTGGTPVACWYPDNPRWTGGDPGAQARLEACEIPILWSQRQAASLASRVDRAEVLPFGYNPNWYELSPAGGDRSGIAFLGTWSHRRERFLSALDGLPVTIAGTGWKENSAIREVSDPIVEAEAGAILRRSVVGVNLLHPQCAGAHNMRTREICASGALQLTDPGTDGTPLSDGDGAMWFDSPQQLRELAERALADPMWATSHARRGQELIAADTYATRGRQLIELCGVAASVAVTPVVRTKVQARVA
jgi:spore maturation protein CgeB